MSSATPHVRVKNDALEIDGVPRYLIGGEAQYFRIRDRGFDAARTHALWAAKLDVLRDHGATVISTYVPWDYHETAPGRFDFGGARDLAKFLDLAAARGLKLIVKPGPFILSEWPYGVGSYGAIPLWWKRANREELVRDRSGRVFCWQLALPSVLGQFRNSQPSYASRKFIEATRRWFEAVLPTFRHHIGPGGAVVALQIDNETNQFWSDAYWIDHHPAALARFRARLEKRYQSLDKLNKAWGRRYTSWADVRPPRHWKAGRRRAPHADWFDHHQEFISEYQLELRSNWRDLGVDEPDVLFLTNDTVQTFPFRELVLPHGVVKNKAGLHALDCYPRCMPFPGRQVFDRPYECDVNAKLLDRYNDLYLGPSRFSFGIEIQGGHLDFFIGPLHLQPHKVRPEATLQTLLRLVAHGMKVINIYTIASGLNLDNSSYDLQAAFPFEAPPRPRAHVFARVARMIGAHEVALCRSRPVESKVGLLASVAMLGPGYELAGEQRIFGDVLREVFGWLAAAGVNAEIEDVTLATAADLRRFDTIFFPCSPWLPAADGEKLRAFVEGGGRLIQLLHPGPLARSILPHETLPLPTRWPIASWLTGASAADFDVGGERGRISVRLSDVPRVKPPADSQPIMSARREEGALGYARRAGEGTAIFLATSPGEPFATAAYYKSETDASLATRARFARALLGERGGPILTCGAPREDAYARIDPVTGDTFWFVFNSHGPGTLTVRASAADRLGIDPARTYVVEEICGEKPAAPREMVGAALVKDGVTMALPDCGATVLRVRGRDQA